MADKNKKVPYKYGEKIDPNNKDKLYILCPECCEFCYCPSQEDTDLICPNGHTWHLKRKGGERFMTKGKC
ncbi:hypothetical protein KKB41_02845 [Patescibacteria group bacterium]|nr:hypothetical protein [Patescibacteria group bacterium]